MDERFYIREADGTRRRIDPAAFPLAIGGRDADIPIPDVATPEPLAHLGLSEREVFVQPSTGRVLVNGSPVTSSAWLRDGDRLSVAGAVIEIESKNGSYRFNITKAPETAADAPVIVAPPTSRPDDVRAGETVKPIAFTPKPLEPARAGRRRMSLRAGIFWLAVVLLAGIAWAVLNARAIDVQVEPAPELVRLEGKPVFLVGGRFLLHPGTYTVVAEKDGYRPLEVPIEVGSERNQSFTFEMTRLPGRLTITTVPADGARVVIDGSEVGTTPLEPVELEPGPHQVLVEAYGYRDFRTEVTIEGAGTMAELEASLEPRFAPVTFRTAPTGARVRVAAKAYGPTPVTANIVEGTHDYEVVLSGYKTHHGKVHVVAGEAQTLEPVPLALVEGTLVLASDPPEASVTLDGEYQGQTPLDLYLTPKTTHQLEVSHPGYDSVRRDVSVASAKTENLTVTLVAQLGEVELVVDPPDAELYVNGERRGRAHQKLQLPAAPQRIEIKKADYESFATDVTPRPGFPQTIEVNLRTNAEVKAASILPAITAPDGQELRLIQPSRFEMGASRREPGRRANETLRTVELTRPYYLATTEVTNRQFRAFRDGHRSGNVRGHNLEVDHHPVVRVTWQDAAAYCNWLSEKESLEPAYVNAGGKLVGASPMTNGYRLPTEAEWALAARYPAGEKLKYPWGNALPVAPGAGNYADAAAEGLVTTTVPGYSDQFVVTAPVDTFAPNALGIRSLGDNVAEWVHDLYMIYPSGSRTVLQDPMGPTDGEFNTIRGASWMHGSITQLRLSFRDYGNKARADVGFRIARYLAE